MYGHPMVTPTRFSPWRLPDGFGIQLILAMAAILWFVRTLTVPITRIIDSLSDGAGQVAAAAREPGRKKMAFGGEKSLIPIYFSFVTLTTLGYGDMVPVSPPARILAILEAVVGQIYLTVLVARLVGLHIVHVTSESRDEPS